MGGKAASTSSARINQLAVQTSALGLAIPRGWGTSRIKCNLLWFGNFRSLSHTEKSGGKGGGVKNTTYSYTASMILGLAHGPILGVRSVYRDKDIFLGSTALTQAGLSLATGELGQDPWPYLTSMFPDQALGYSGTAYVYAQDYSLTDSASLQNHSFEVQFASHIASIDDADPSIIVSEAIQETPGWLGGMIGSLTTYENYCLASNLVLSPALEQQQTVSDFLSEILQATNSEAVWSEGQIKIRTYGDEAASGNGRTFSPDLTPIYDLTEDDLMPQGGEDGPPVTQEIVDQTDAYNIIQVEYLDRSNQYNTAIATAQDLDNIIQYGPRKKDPISLHAICDPQIAQHVAQLILQRTLYRRTRYKFQLPWSFILLEPMDYVTLTTTTDQLRLNRALVQIKEIEEDEDGQLSFTAEGVETGTASAALYNAHSGEGYAINTGVAPGSASNPVIFVPPAGLLTLEGEVWLAVSSTSPTWGGCNVWVSADNANYRRLGTIQDAARYGSLTADLPMGADPDTTNILHVDLSDSLGYLNSGSDADLNSGTTLLLVGDELVSYRDAMLTGSYRYDLSPLRRGLQGTQSVTHGAGARVVRLDSAIFHIPYSDLQASDTMYVKLTSFNSFGLAEESLADVPYQTISLANLPKLDGGRLVDSSVDTPQIKTGAVTDSVRSIYTSTYTGSGSTWIEVARIMIDPKYALQTDIFGNAQQTYGSSDSQPWGIRIKVDGTVVKSFDYKTRGARLDVLSIQRSGLSLSGAGHVVTLEWAGNSAITLSDIDFSVLQRFA